MSRLVIEQLPERGANAFARSFAATLPGPTRCANSALKSWAARFDCRALHH